MKRRLILGAAAAMLSILGAATAYAAVEGINGGPGVMMEENMAEQTADTMKGNSTEKFTDKDSQTPEQTALAEGPVTAFGTDVSRIDIPEDAEVLVIVEGSGLDAAVSAYTKDTEAGAWELLDFTSEGKLGRKGLGKEVEGDEKTPMGIFKMNTPFGIKDALEGFPDNYIKVTPDLYWNGDSDSELYNRLVSTNTYDDFNKSKSEHLIDYAGYYNYCIDTGYNPEGTPHRGSALFLHCSMGINTGGCIAIPEETMIQILKEYKEGKTYIAIGDVTDMQKLYRASEEA